MQPGPLEAHHRVWQHLTFSSYATPTGTLVDHQPSTSISQEHLPVSSQEHLQVSSQEHLPAKAISQEHLPANILKHLPTSKVATASSQ